MSIKPTPVFGRDCPRVVRCSLRHKSQRCSLHALYAETRPYAPFLQFLGKSLDVARRDPSFGLDDDPARFIPTRESRDHVNFAIHGDWARPFQEGPSLGLKEVSTVLSCVALVIDKGEKRSSFRSSSVVLRTSCATASESCASATRNSSVPRSSCSVCSSWRARRWVCSAESAAIRVRRDSCCFDVATSSCTALRSSARSRLTRSKRVSCCCTAAVSSRMAWTSSATAISRRAKRVPCSCTVAGSCRGSSVRTCRRSSSRSSGCCSTSLHNRQNSSMLDGT